VAEGAVAVVMIQIITPAVLKVLKVEAALGQRRGQQFLLDLLEYLARKSRPSVRQKGSALRSAHAANHVRDLESVSPAHLVDLEFDG
jgi:hypothetical protein